MVLTRYLTVVCQVKINVDAEDNLHGLRNSVSRRHSYEQRPDATVACNQNLVSVKLQVSNELHTKDC